MAFKHILFQKALKYQIFYTYTFDKIYFLPQNVSYLKFNNV